MRVRLLTIAAIAVGAFSVSAAAAPRQDRTVGIAASGSTVRLKVGERLTVRLTECRTCGYTWTTTRHSRGSVLRRLSNRYVAPKLPPGAVGGSGHRVQVFRAVGTGSTSFRLIERAPDGHRAGAFVLQVGVRP